MTRHEEKCLMNNLVSAYVLAPQKMYQVERCNEITEYLTSDAGLDIEVETFKGNIQRFTATGCRAGFSIVIDLYNMKVVRKPRGLKAVMKMSFHCNGNKLLKMIKERIAFEESFVAE